VTVLPPDLATPVRIRRVPSARRDWRFWASLAAALLSACVTIAFVSVLIDRNDWRNRFDESSKENGCRSAAAIFADTASATATNIQGAGLAALSEGVDVTPYAKALEIASENALRALAARDGAVEICPRDPTYRISPSVLLPIPPYPRIDLNGDDFP
jgi:hypothetical protein